MTIPVRDTAEGAKFLVRVTPRASRTAIVGVFGDGNDAALKIALQAPPVEGRANTALIEFLAELTGTARSTIEIIGGETARTKTILVHGKSAAEITRALERGLGR